MKTGFEFNGYSSQDFYLQFGNFNSSDTNTTLSKTEYSTFQPATSEIQFFTGSKYPEMLTKTFGMVYVPNGCDIENIPADVYEDIVYWLTPTDKFHKFNWTYKDDDDPLKDIYYMAKFDVVAIYNGDNVCGLELTVTTNAPYGFSDVIFSGNNKIEILTKSSADAYELKTLNLQAFGDGELKIETANSDAICYTSILNHYDEEHSTMMHGVKLDFTQDYISTSEGFSPIMALLPGIPNLTTKNPDFAKCIGHKLYVSVYAENCTDNLINFNLFNQTFEVNQGGKIITYNYPSPFDASVPEETLGVLNFKPGQYHDNRYQIKIIDLTQTFRNTSIPSLSQLNELFNTSYSLYNQPTISSRHETILTTSIINNCSSNEEITITENKVITSSDTQHNLYDDFNFVYPELYNNGYNSSKRPSCYTISANGKITATVRERRKVGL